MFEPEMIEAVIDPLFKSESIPCTVLAMHITDEKQWLNKDTVKIIHNNEGKVLYTTRGQFHFQKIHFHRIYLQEGYMGFLHFVINT